MKNTVADELSEMIIDALCERRGFENWWYDLEDEDQEEIYEELEEVIREWQDDNS